MEQMPILVFVISRLPTWHRSLGPEIEEKLQELNEELADQSPKEGNNQEKGTELPDDSSRFETASYDDEEDSDYAWIGKESPPEYLFIREKEMDARGGLAALEDDLGETCRWFWQLGRIQIAPQRGGTVRLPISMIQPLVDSWVERGSPKKDGWRMRQVKVKRELERALVDDAKAASAKTDPEDTIGAELREVSPALSQIPRLFERLAEGETVKTNLSVAVSITVERKAYERQVQIRYEKEHDTFIVSVVPPGETQKDGSSNY